MGNDDKVWMIGVKSLAALGFVGRFVVFLFGF